MGMNRLGTLVTLAAAGVALVAALALTFPGSNAVADSTTLDMAPSRCETYTFSSCPNGCVQQCIPSNCSGIACTADCDGPGSCSARVPVQGND